MCLCESVYIWIPQKYIGNENLKGCFNFPFLHVNIFSHSRLFIFEVMHSSDNIPVCKKNFERQNSNPPQEYATIYWNAREKS